MLNKTNRLINLARSPNRETLTPSYGIHSWGPSPRTIPGKCQGIPLSRDSNHPSYTLRFPPMIDVLIVDDHPVMRELLRQVLELYKDVMVVAEAESGEDAITQAMQFQPAVALAGIFDHSSPGIASSKLLSPYCHNLKRSRRWTCFIDGSRLP